MIINKTTDYFKMTVEEAGERINESNTREEAEVLDSGLEYYFFETLEGITKEFNLKDRSAYTERKKYDGLLFEFVADNDNHNKYCMVFA